MQKTKRTTSLAKNWLGKNGLKLTYGKGTDGNATNFPYVLVVGIACAVIFSSSDHFH